MTISCEGMVLVIDEHKRSGGLVSAARDFSFQGMGGNVDKTSIGDLAKGVTCCGHTKNVED